ncbi:MULTISPECIES: cold shock domain-containing protein [Aeromonas]|uniref:cold shock domain-containing protein n=1 Tax=Aeromonas TaxID=642 RepID=UPI000D12594A|nr:cold shock domain-containing protein [Aeromonas rivipollensis]AVP94593.1 hypothetical protein C7N77_16385 [Aeromonas rivipollensis]
MKGKITQWNDDKGFGFIIPDDRSEKIFFHISTINPRSRRPQINDDVWFEATVDSQQRMRATVVYYEGLTLLPIKSRAKQNSHIKSQSSDKKIILEPVRKTLLDYLLLVIAIVSLALAGFNYFKTNDVTISVLIALPTAFFLALFNRSKTPSSKLFTCSRCRCNVPFDNRTIRAWNMGTLKLYCSNCHAEWLLHRETPNHNPFSSSSRGSGCLGTLAILIAIPVGLLSIANWLS